ncbi:MAG: hypothetical protein L6R40_002218 [Gallowayella cf. fulva]|nr:MAG: hypothetical protein L6R40_002218 [Xanthomendoza cf. fulva]
MHHHTAGTSLNKKDGLLIPATPPGFDLTTFPSIYVLHAHIPVAELHDIEQHLLKAGAQLTYDIREASIVLGDISKPRRAKFELQAGKVRFKQIESPRCSKPIPASQAVLKPEDPDCPPMKRRKLQQTATQSTTDESNASEQQDSSTIGSETESENDAGAAPLSQLSVSEAPTSPTVDSSPPLEVPGSLQIRDNSANLIKVINLQWLKDSIRLRKPQDLQAYLVYEAELLPSDAESPVPDPPTAAPVKSKSEAKPKTAVPPCVQRNATKEILERSKADAGSRSKPGAYFSRASKRDRISDAARHDFSNRSFTSTTSQDPSSHRRHLLHQTTSEYEEDVSGPLPPMPDWVLQNRLYSCQRATPLNNPNDAFIAQLKEIKFARLLMNDEIGVRAYSTSIASLAAYPYKVQSTSEILALPGCNQKIARLFYEWRTSPDHRIQAVRDIENDAALKVLRLFYEIWGVGATTAREFYYDKKWRDLDDIVEFGWSSLSRVQQIGVKYYDEFQLKIPRTEVEAIADIVKHHAQKVVDERIQCVVVGGYRRGKAESGDVDLILSHPEQSATAGLVDKVVRSLEEESWITHTLTLNLTNTKRGQETLPYITNTKGAGFDTLDKALVVWQDQAHCGKGSTDVKGKQKKNPNPHRRVDIIISPWRTVGCAVAGWTSGTTFQRDLRRYAKKVKGWKFDSSGVRERGSGKWIDLEGWADPKTRCTDAYEAERRVFEGLGLEYREPWDRCTG